MAVDVIHVQESTSSCFNGKLASLVEREFRDVHHIRYYPLTLIHDEPGDPFEYRYKLAVEKEGFDVEAITLEMFVGNPLMRMFGEIPNITNSWIIYDHEIQTGDTMRHTRDACILAGYRLSQGYFLTNMSRIRRIDESPWNSEPYTREKNVKLLLALNTCNMIELRS